VFRHQILRLPATAGDIFFTQTFICHTCLFLRYPFYHLAPSFSNLWICGATVLEVTAKFNSILRVDNQIKFSSSAWDNILDMQVVTYKEQLWLKVVLFKSSIKELHH